MTESQPQSLPRPPQWGGFRLSIRIVELWSAGKGRLRDQIQWTRMRAVDAESEEGERVWGAQRLSP